MNKSLINYSGLDNIDSNIYENLYRFNFNKNIIMDNLYDVLSINTDANIVKYKTIDIFEDSNYEDLNVESNLIILNCKFIFMVEYSNLDNKNCIHICECVLYKSFLIFPSKNKIYKDINMYIIDVTSNFLKNEIFIDVYVGFDLI